MTLVELRRGPALESVHEGHVAVVDREGRTLFEHGDPGVAVFPRSAIKLLQALPLVETGAADAFGFNDRELALACASHSGEPEHVALARSMLERIGLAEPCLACSGHWSLRQPVLLQQARTHATTPGALHNNCSGKHAGLLAVCRHQGWPAEGYAEPDHPIQRHLAAILAALTGEVHDKRNRAVDGCSIPTYAVPLRSLARAFARAFSPEAAPPHRSAAERLVRAAMAEPFHAAGTDRFCTDYMRGAAGRAYAKTGAEGVYCGVLPERGIAIALNVADGATRASEIAFATVANAFLARHDLARFESAPITTWGGSPVGVIRAAEGFRENVLAAASECD